MEKIINMMNQMNTLQGNILREFNNINYNKIDADFYTTAISNNESKLIDQCVGEKQYTNTKINIEKIEQLEKCCFTLSMVNNNLLQILNASKQLVHKLQDDSAYIRSEIKKTRQIKNNNKFINILSDKLNNNKLNLITSEILQRKSIKQHDYILVKSVKLVNDFFVDIPIIDSLNHLNSAFYWFNGDKKHNSGIYMALCNNFIIQVPFPDLICKNKGNFKQKSAPCKYKDIDNCNTVQTELSRKYKTEFRNCNYVHKGESFIKIGSDFRCPNTPSFGCYDSLESDINNVSLQDIKTILMNASSDLLLILLWYEHHKNLGDIIFTNLDRM